MKRYFYILAGLALAASIVSCEKDKYGTNAGHDSAPNVVLNVFSAELPNDPDCDALVRFAANNATTDVYYFAELQSEKEKRNLSDEAYADYVVANGTKLSMDKFAFDGAFVADAVVKNLYFDNVISAVAVGKGSKSISSVTFTGLKWNTISTGTYTYKVLEKILQPKKGVMLQQQENDNTQFRFKDLYDKGHHLTFFTIDKSAKDKFGTYQFARIPVQGTGIVHSTLGPINVRDVGYWQGNDAFVTEKGFESCLYEDYRCFMYAQYYVSKGSLGYNYDEFVPDN